MVGAWEGGVVRVSASVLAVVVLLSTSPASATRDRVQETVELVSAGTSAYETLWGMPNVRKPRCDAERLERMARWTSIRLRRLERVLGLHRGPVYSCRKTVTSKQATKLFWRFVAVETRSG